MSKLIDNWKSEYMKNPTGCIFAYLTTTLILILFIFNQQIPHFFNSVLRASAIVCFAGVLWFGFMPNFNRKSKVDSESKQ